MQQQQESESNVSRSATKRWWQEELPPPTAVTPATVTQEVAPTVVTERDIGEELEEEARQRALTTDTEITVPLEFASYQRRVFRKALWFLAPLALLMTIAVISISTRPGAATHMISNYFVLAVIWVEVVVIALLPRWTAQTTKQSEIRLSRRGIHMSVGRFDYGQIPWEDIAVIRPYRLILQSYIGIELKDPLGYAERCDVRLRGVIRFAEHSNRFLRRFGVFCPTFALPKHVINMPTEELLALMTAARCSSDDQFKS